MSIDTVIQMYEGMHFEGEIRMLNRTAAGITDGVIVAIGSYRGQMDCALALHAQVPVYAIDDRGGSVYEDFPFSDEDRTHWMLNVLTMGLGAKIRPINLPSEVVGQGWQDPIGLLFIDGSHDYSSVRNDLYNFLPRVIAGGLVALHDTNREGVIRAIADFAQSLELIEQADLTQVYRKIGEAPGIEITDVKITYNVLPSGDDMTPVYGESTAPVSQEIDESLFEHVRSAPRHPSQKPKAKTTARKKK